MSRFSIKRAAILLLIIVIEVAGCGGDKDTSVYDTQANPYGFPTQACELIDGIESGQLVSYDVITESFGRLYLENQELLENNHWKEIIEKLGKKFEQRADEMIAAGISSYSQAAGFYMLASFSNPNNAALAETAALFATWKERMEKMDYDYTPYPTSSEFTDRLEFLRCFVLGDSLERRLADRFLVHQLLDSIISASGDRQLSELSRPDQALLSFLGIGDMSELEPLTSVAGLPVDLLAARVVTVGPQRVRAELYLEATEEISEDFHVSIAIDSSQVTNNEQLIHFAPVNPTSRWKVGQVQPAAVEIPFGYGTARIKYTLSRKVVAESDSVTFEIVHPPVTLSQPLTVERLQNR